MDIINQEIMSSVTKDRFKKSWPFPWAEIKDLIKPDRFSQLYREFPSLELLEYHQGIARDGYQRSHDRYYAAYEKSPYAGTYDGKGKALTPGDLSSSWNAFLEELLHSPEYHQWISDLFETDRWKIRMAWHIGKSGNEVSPHRDDKSKLGTHIFYFNISEDWDPAWGGQILVLGDLIAPKTNPEVSDFVGVIPVQINDNRSFLFENTRDAWHGVLPLKCPEGKYRRLFNVIFEKK